MLPATEQALHQCHTDGIHEFLIIITSEHCTLGVMIIMVLHALLGISGKQCFSFCKLVKLRCIFCKIQNGLIDDKEVNKPSIADVLEYQGWRMECSVESTLHEEACIYSSAYDGGEVLTQFGELTKNDETDEIPTRAQGEYVTTSNPWPREEAKESMEVARIQKRKPCPTRRQGNRWDQYGESSSASPSEAHGMSDSSVITVWVCQHVTACSSAL